MELETSLTNKNQENVDLKRFRNHSKGSTSLFQNHIHRQTKDTKELKSMESNENQENEDKNVEVEKVEENDTEKQEEKRSIKKLVKKANAAKNISLLGRVPQKGNTFNMELAKALGILGFQNTRWMETSKYTGVTPKQILDQAHFTKTMFINKQRRKEEEEREKNDGKEVNEKFTKKMSYDDQIRQLHEAYQFLIKRYKLQESIANVSLMVQSFEKQQKRMEKMAIQSENIKKEEMENVGKSAKKVDDADKQELKRKPSSSLKRTKKTPKNN